MTGPSAASMWPEWLRGSALGCDGASPARPSRPSALLHDNEANAPGDRAAQLVRNGARCLRNALDRQADAPQPDRIARACFPLAAQVDGHQVPRPAPDHLRRCAFATPPPPVRRVARVAVSLPHPLPPPPPFPPPDT